MKKILVALALAVSAPAFAIDCRRGVDHKHPACYGYSYVDHRHMNYHRPTVVYRNNDWVGPAIVSAIGTAIVIDVMNRRQETQIVVQPTVGQSNQICTPWTETLQSDGTITRTRTCNQ
jgi:putative Mn2+ efflux pump MntP